MKNLTKSRYLYLCNCNGGTYSSKLLLIHQSLTEFLLANSCIKTRNVTRDPLWSSYLPLQVILRCKDSIGFWSWKLNNTTTLDNKVKLTVYSKEIWWGSGIFREDVKIKSVHRYQSCRHPPPLSFIILQVVLSSFKRTNVPGAPCFIMH